MTRRPRRYITRPPISEQRLSIAGNGNIVYALKTPYADGTTHIVLSPLEFIGRLAALAWPAAFKPSGKLDAIPWGILTKQQAPQESGTVSAD